MYINMSGFFLVERCFSRLVQKHLFLIFIIIIKIYTINIFFFFKIVLEYVIIVINPTNIF